MERPAAAGGAGLCEVPGAALLGWVPRAATPVAWEVEGSVATLTGRTSFDEWATGLASEGCAQNLRQLYIAMRAMTAESRPPGRWPWEHNVPSHPIGRAREWARAALDCGEVTDDPVYICPVSQREPYLGPIVDPNGLRDDDVVLVCPPENHSGPAIVVLPSGEVRTMTRGELDRTDWRRTVGEE